MGCRLAVHACDERRRHLATARGCETLGNDDYAQTFSDVLGGFIAIAKKGAAARRKILIVLIDGFGPEYAAQERRRPISND